MEVGQKWSLEEIKVAAERGPHTLDLATDVIEIMHAEVEEKFKDVFAQVIYFDEIKDILGTKEWAHLNIFPLAMVPQKSRKYRAILDLSFSD